MYPIENHSMSANLNNKRFKNNITPICRVDMAADPSLFNIYLCREVMKILF